MREIQEARNALKTYDAFSTFDPYKQVDLLRAHSLLMEALVDNHGKYRRGNVGVFAGDSPIHVAAPAHIVPKLMDDLFEWLTFNNNHLLIKSCVFHYEFEFIHPFMDGNGRIGRLWQSLLLAKLHPIFEYLPVETMVFKNQQRYYQAINNSTNIADSAIFVEFMLGEILTTLKNRQGEPLQCLTTNSMSRAVNGVVSGVVKTVYDFIEQNPGCRKPQIAEKTEIPIKTVEKHITKLKAMNKIIFVGSPKSGGYYVKMDE